MSADIEAPTYNPAFKLPADTPDFESLLAEAMDVYIEAHGGDPAAMTEEERLRFIVTDEQERDMEELEDRLRVLVA